MLKRYLFLSILLISILLITGCINSDFDFGDSNNNNQPPTTDEWELSSVIQLTDFTNNLCSRFN